MMSWEVIRERYKSAGRAAEQADEDMIGRHMLSALGISNPAKNIYGYEQGLLGAVGDPASPFLSRAIRLAVYILGRGENVRRLFGGSLPVLSCERALSHKLAVAAVAEDAEDAGTPIVHLSRTGDRACTAVYLADTHQLDLLEPPFVVLAYYGDKRDRACVSQPMPAFFTQLGPYDLSV